MYSWEFALQYPVLTGKQADRIVIGHGLDPDEAKVELGEDYTRTKALLAWLGY